MRRWLVVVGLLAVTAGVVSITVPGVVYIGAADGVLVGAAVIALVAGAHALKTAASGERMEVSTADVEVPDAVDVPGDDVDRTIDLATPPASYYTDRRSLRLRASDLVEAVLIECDGRHPDDASQAIADRTWTTDTHAASYVVGRPPGGHLLQRLRRRFATEHSVEQGLRRSLDATAEYIPGASEPSPPDDERGWLAGLATPMRGVSPRPRGSSQTGHWRGISAVALVGIGLGAVLELPSLLLAGSVGIGYVAYARFGSAPDPRLRVERELSPTEPEPGEPVSVVLRVTNGGDRLLPDLRIVDGVPTTLRVVAGHARRGVALRPGESTTLRYAIEARPGRHDWESISIVARSLNGSYEVAGEESTETALTCIRPPNPVRATVPLRASGSTTVGEVPTDRTGEGVAFQSVRGYRRGDRQARIDWRRYARSRELTTIEYREERATTVVVTVDARQAAYLAPDPDSPGAVERSIVAADRLVPTLLGAGHRVGITSMAPDPLWLAPSAERATAHRVREILATHPSVGPTSPSANFVVYGWMKWLRTLLPGDSQLILISPLCDDLVVHLIIRFEAHGHPVTVLSPDPTVSNTLGRRLASVERQVRLARLRGRGITVVDWPADELLDESLLRMAGRWPR